MGTIKIGSSINKKGIIINPIKVLFNTKNVKKIISGSVIIWENIIALIPKMTSNTEPSGEASASSSESGNTQPYKCFDKDITSINNGWVSNGETSAWVQYKFSNQVCVKKYEVTARVNYSKQFPKNFQLKGSNNGSTWEQLDTQTITTQPTDTLKYSISNDKYFQYYRLECQNPFQDTIAIGEIQLYGFYA